jgi:hypothetical protein
MSEYLTVTDLAARIKKHPNWIYSQINRWPHSRFGTSIRFTEDDITKIENLHRRTPATPTRRNIGTRKRKNTP